MPMSEFRLEDKGGGCFLLSGKMTFGSVNQILDERLEMFDEHPRIEVDLSGVTKSDSAGVALLLEWITLATHNVR